MVTSWVAARSPSRLWGRRLSARAPYAKIYIGRASAASTDARENLDPRRKADVDRLPREGTRRSQRSRKSRAMILASRPHSRRQKGPSGSPCGLSCGAPRTGSGLLARLGFHRLVRNRAEHQHGRFCGFACTFGLASHLHQEATGDLRPRLAPLHALLAERHSERILRACDAYITKPALLIDALAVDDRALMRQQAFLHADHVNMRKF